VGEVQNPACPREFCDVCGPLTRFFGVRKKMSSVSKELVDHPLSNRVMQAYGAACIVKFCAARCIRSVHVDQLVKYLLKLLSSDNIPEWESAGSVLELSGRENVLPEAVADRLTAHDRVAFLRILESVAEIGIVDMYGADTNGPTQALCEATRILSSCGIEAPSIAELYAMVRSQRGWGEPLPDNQVHLLEVWCLSHWGERGSQSSAIP